MSNDRTHLISDETATPVVVYKKRTKHNRQPNESGKHSQVDNKAITSTKPPKSTQEHPVSSPLAPKPKLLTTDPAHKIADSKRSAAVEPQFRAPLSKSKDVQKQLLLKADEVSKSGQSTPFGSNAVLSGANPPIGDAASTSAPASLGPVTTVVISAPNGTGVHVEQQPAPPTAVDKRTGRYLALAVTLIMIFITLYHSFLRHVPMLAGLVPPAIIMVLYLLYVIYFAKKKKRQVDIIV